MNKLIALCADFYWELDTQCRFVQFRSTGTDAGLSAGAMQEALGKAPWDVSGLIPKSTGWAQLQDIVARRASFQDIEWHWTADPAAACMTSVCGEPVFDDCGLFVGYRGLMRDITEKKRLEEQYRRFRVAMDASGDPILLVDREAMRFVDMNETAVKATGYTRDELLAMGPQDLLLADRAAIEREFDEVIAAGCCGAAHEGIGRNRSGETKQFEMQRRAIRFDDRWIIVSTSRDITSRKQAKKVAVRLGQMYAAINGTNEAILRARTPEELYRQVCEVAVRGGTIDNASILLPDPESDWARIAAVAGEGVDTLRSVRISFSEDRPEGQGLTGTAFRSRKACVVHDIVSDPRTRLWSDAHGKEHTAAGTAIPLVRNGQSIGVLLLYSRDREAFDEEILQLLERMARNIVFALDNFDREAERREAVDALRASEEKYRSILENIEEAYYEVDLKGTLTLCNEAFGRMFGYTLDEITGLNYSQYHRPEAVPHVFASFNEVYRTGATKKGIEWELLHKNGGGVLCEGSIHLVRDAGGEPVGFRGIMRDVTERRKMEVALRKSEERLRHLASHDMLTGLPNRMMFTEMLGQQVQQARRYGRRFALMFIDLDHFKAVNDSFGHAAGDLLLKETARRLRESVRASDFVARLAGDEFVVIVQEVGDMEQLRTIAEKVVTSLRCPMTLAGNEHRVTASVGICVFPDDGGDEEALLRHADAAMYQVKHGTKDSFKFYLQGN